MELGVYSFGDVHQDPVTGAQVSPQQRMADLLERARLADEVGLDYFGLGEHHRPEYAISSPVPVLAAAAAQTKNIKVGSAVTVLSTEDPVRVYQQFATLDLLSGGRAELTAGRGSFIESYPLFGADLNDYEELYEEKIALLLALNEAGRKEEPITWSGKFRPALEDATIYPRPVNNNLDIWIATGGTPSSTARAAALGTNVIYALLGGAVSNFARHAQLFRAGAEQAGHDAKALKVGVSAVGLVSKNNATETFYPYWRRVMEDIARERGFTPPNRISYNMQTAPAGAIYTGTPEQVAEKILLTHQHMGHDRHILEMDFASVPQTDVLKSIELFGTEVKPLIDAELRNTKKVSA
ncbi:LLM class flavin-dependent oxidoreductase [Specibacter sp. NPDC078692]|uniref:LLM class flavin-dependent oxidoreductase n=1 Tax=Specibacter sp. NPDC078692 TaxID=3155818 RepID=UPI0034253DAD